MTARLPGGRARPLSWGVRGELPRRVPPVSHPRRQMRLHTAAVGRRKEIIAPGPRGSNSLPRRAPPNGVPPDPGFRARYRGASVTRRRFVQFLAMLTGGLGRSGKGRSVSVLVDKTLPERQDQDLQIERIRPVSDIK